VKGQRLVIHIRAGLYREDVEVGINKVLLIGDGVGKTVISGNRSKAGGLESDNTPVLCKFPCSDDTPVFFRYIQTRTVPASISS
jgi:pectin methylesterase-like acyl-CoA thioesterase